MNDPDEPIAETSSAVTGSAILLWMCTALAILSFLGSSLYGVLLFVCYDYGYQISDMPLRGVLLGLVAWVALLFFGGIIMVLILMIPIALCVCCINMCIDAYKQERMYHV